MDYNPFLPEVQDNPFPYYAYLRQHAPVYQVPGVGLWVISRYDDVTFAFKNPQLFSSASISSAVLGDFNPFPPEAVPLVALDPPVHTLQRKIVNRAFTPRRIASLEAHLREVVHHLIERMAAQGDCDLMRDLAVPLPSTIIAELLGVPLERQHDFKRWSDDMVRATNGAAVPQEDRAPIRQSLDEYRAYFQEAIEGYRKHLGDNLLSDLVRAEEEDQRLTAAQLLSTAVLLLLAGNETTTNLIGNAMLALLAHPQEFAKVRANPALIPHVVEETLRYDSPVQMFFRQATQEVEVAGTRIPAGSVVSLLIGSANHDERKFPDPDRYDILRNTEGHIAFGFGVHFCLGAQLARLEATVALTALFGNFPRLAGMQEHLTRIESPIIRGVKTLPLVVGLAAA